MVSMLPGCLDSSIAKACKGISGRVVACCAGDKSSVLVSPGTLNTVTVMVSGKVGREVNQSAAAQDSITCFAWGLVLANSSTSLKASYTSMILLNAVVAADVNVSSSDLSKSINDCTL